MSIKRRIVDAVVFCRTYRHWKQKAKQVQASAYKDDVAPCLVIVPCDPWSVGGSRGDEAMITGVVQQYLCLYPNISIYMVCADEKGAEYIKGLSAFHIKPIASWNGAYSLCKVYDSIKDVRPTDVVILGADCMDGFYSPLLSLSLLALHDLFTKTVGVRSRLLGFSFNEHPSWLMVRAFKSLSPEVRIRLRDEVSLSRYKDKVNSRAALVADAAFMLKPQSDFPLCHTIRDWAEQRKSEGNTIIGLNFHPMLRTYRDADDIKLDARLLARNVERILLRHKHVCFVFISHDDRSGLTDNLMLSTMYESLGAYSQRIFYKPEVPRAPQLKALCGLLDGLVSSRMHLAIAALGMKVPVMAATYQGKFEGLFRHFGLDGTYLLSPQEFLSDAMPKTFDFFIAALPALKEQIVAKLPYVCELSAKNLKDE